MYTVLVCDDDEKIRSLISKYVTFKGNKVIEASNGAKAIDLARKNEIDIIILDIMMPQLDGFSTVKEIRKFSEVPILMLSARREEYDRIHGFELGADDYIVKPFSPKELMMRMDAIMKRIDKEKNLRHQVYTKNTFSIDFTARVVTIDNEEVYMSPKEYELLFFLVKNKGVAVPREVLISEVWGYDFYGDDRTLDTHIKLLRKHMGEYSKLIVTLRGIGYRFDG